MTSPGETLHVRTPRLPIPKGTLRGTALETQLYLENCADRLTTRTGDESPKLRLLDAVTMSLDGLSYRLTLKKGWHFHCGAEVTASDAVDTFQHVLKDTHSASQLHRYVARVYAASKYRFEIVLTRRLPDLLARLALPELSLRHAGSPCFSGPWKVVEAKPDALTLAVHASHPEANALAYKKVVWQPLLEVPDFHANDEAFVFAYHGTEFRSPPEELLTDEICRPLEGGASVLVQLDGPHALCVDVKTRIARAARACFGKNSLWRRSPLRTLAPKGHKLHMPFPPEVHLPETRRVRLVLDVQAAGAMVPARTWEKLAAVAEEECGLEIEVGSGAPSSAQVSLRGRLRIVPHTHGSDVYTTLLALTRDGEEVPSQEGRIAELCQSVTRDPRLAPLLAVPFVVRSNRNIRKSEGTGVFHFGEVRQSSDRLRKLRMHDATLMSLGAALQMFVHDVKRPFSMVQGIIGLMEAAPTPARLREVATRFLPDVKKAASSVDRLIQDILEIGSDAEPNRDEVAVPLLVDGVVREALAMAEAAHVAFDYRFAHRHLLHADPQKISRAMSNLVVNALEAMAKSGGKGTVWFATSEDTTKRTLTVTVGNTNSLIRPELLSGLFDRFFTEGKKRGTGLGLAIVKKIVGDHGGEVWCESDEAAGTRFHMTLPLASHMDRTDSLSLPRTVACVATKKAAHAIEEETLETRGSLRVLLVDDSPLYLEMIQELLAAAEKEKAGLTFATASDGTKALEAFRKGSFDALIVDVDLGEASEDGLTLVGRFRALDPNVKICVHSSGSPFDLQKKAIAAGADLFLPKPMAREHLIRLLQSASTRASTERPTRPTPTIAVIDDDALILETWECLSGYVWKTYDGPRALLAACDADPGLLATFHAVVTDFKFPAEEPDGEALAAELTRRRPDLQVFLSTNHPGVKGSLPKEAAAALKELERRLT